LSKVACAYTLWKTCDFERLQLHKYNILVFNKFQSLHFSLLVRPAASWLCLQMCSPRGQKGWTALV